MNPDAYSLKQLFFYDGKIRRKTDREVFRLVDNDVIKYEIIVNKEHYDVISKLEIGCIRVSIMDLIKY